MATSGGGAFTGAVTTMFGKSEKSSVCLFHASCITHHATPHQPHTYTQNKQPRFGFFCGAASEYLRVRDLKPDVLHCHDWQSAPVAWGERPNNAKCVFTIHNLNYGADLVGRAMAAAEVATTVSPTYAREVSSV